LVAKGIVGHIAVLTIEFVAKGSRELAEPHECSPSKAIAPV
jgi:hypothetical protein